MPHSNKPARTGAGKLRLADIVTLAAEVAAVLSVCIALHALVT